MTTLAPELDLGPTRQPAARAAAKAATRTRWRIGSEALGLIFVSSLLLAFGLAVLYSASADFALSIKQESWYFLYSQLTGVAVGAVVFAIAAKVDAGRLEKLAWPLMIIALVTMIAVLVPGVGKVYNGSRRFLLGSSLQPSEFAKLALVMWVSMLIVKKGDNLRRLTKGLLPFLVVVGFLDLLAVLEPDLSIAMLFTLLMGVLLFTGGARMGHFVFLAALTIPAGLANIQRLQYVPKRLQAFFSPDYGYQQLQSLVAVGSGGVFGRGYGEGMQQFGFLPVAHSDFIGAIIGEEWGFVGITGVTIAFAAYALLGFRIARNARSPFLKLVAVGLTFTTVLTAYIHLGVVIGLLPNTGLTLPFISYGRSNLVLTMLCTGILVNIGSTRERVVGSTATDPLAIGG